MLLVGFVMGQLASPQAALADSVQIGNFTNITVPLWINGDPTIIQTVLVCVYRDIARTYAITATGSGPGFLLNSGANSMAYTVAWNDGGAANPAGGTTTQLVNNVKLTTRNNARIATDVPINSSNCNSGSSPTAQLSVTITNTVMDGAADGTFTGTLTLVLSPT